MLVHPHPDEIYVQLLVNNTTVFNLQRRLWQWEASIQQTFHSHGLGCLTPGSTFNPQVLFGI